jgi:hypothetical protein
VLEEVAGSGTVQTAEPAQIIIELVLSRGREDIVDLFCGAGHVGYDSRVFSLAASFTWERFQKRGLIIEEIVV